MFRTRIRKILRDVLARKGRTALVSTAIFIGVTGTIALFSMSDILISQLKADVKENELAMAQVTVTTKEATLPDNVAYLKMLGTYPGVTEVQAGIEDRPVFFKVNENDTKFENGLVQAYTVLAPDGLTLLEAPFETPAPIEPIHLLEGGAWPSATTNELVVEQRMAKEYGLKTGDTLYMRALSPSRDPQQNGATGTTESWIITGIVFDPYANTPKSALYASTNNAMYLTGLTGLSDWWFRFTDYSVAEGQFDKIVDLIARNTDYTPVFAQTEDPSKNQLITNAQLFANLMSFLALVSLVVSGFLVVNVITSLVVEQKRQIGVMKSMGATRWDNFVMYSGIAFAYGLIGVIPGVIVGIPGGNAAAHALAPQLNTVLQGFHVSTSSIVLGVVIGLLVPVGASILPVFNGTRVQILDAMTDLGIDANYGTGFFARIIGVLPIPITVRQGLSNVSLKKSRLAFTVITLAIAVGAFMGIFALFASLTDGIQTFLDSWNIDLGLNPAEARDPAQIYAILDENFKDQIKSVQPGFFQQVEFEGYTPNLSTGGPPGIIAYGYDIESDNPAFVFEINKGSKLTAETADTGIILSSLLASNMHKSVGDTVILKVPGNSKAFTVVGISNFPIEQCWLDWRTLAILTDSTIDTITSDTPVPANLIPADARGYIKYLSVAKVDGYTTTASSPLPGVLIMGFAPSVAQFLQIEDGAFPTTDQPGVIITTDMAQSGHYAVGDTLSLESLSPEGHTASYAVVGIFSPPTTLQQAGNSLPTAFIGMIWRNAIDLDGATVDVVPRPGAYFIKVSARKPSAKQIDDLLNNINDIFVSQGIAVVGLNFVDLTEQISRAFFTIQAILSAVALLIALVGALGLLTTLSMSVYERQKEIGVMRSIGAGSSTVVIQFLTEGLVVGVISWLVGIPLMVLIQIALLNITGFSETFPFKFSVPAVVIGLIGILIVTTIASLWPSLAAARKTVSDILRYQ